MRVQISSQDFQNILDQVTDPIIYALLEHAQKGDSIVIAEKRHSWYAPIDFYGANISEIYDVFDDQVYDKFGHSMNEELHRQFTQWLNDGDGHESVSLEEMQEHVGECFLAWLNEQ